MARRRIVVAGPDEKADDRQAQILARMLRDGGHEVTFAGSDQLVRQIVMTAIAEDATAIGLPGADRGTRSAVAALLVERDADDIDLWTRRASRRYEG